MEMKQSLSKKDKKVINGMPKGVQKKFIKLMEDLSKKVEFKEFKQVYDVSEMWIPGYEGKNIYRVKFDFRFRAFVQVQPNGNLDFVKVVSREDAY
jgi:hypothetical protein